MQAHAQSPPSVAIIGAGWAGLACALKLAQAGYKPVVYESAPEPGGRARRARFKDGVSDIWHDNGQHLILSGCQALKSLMHDIGADIGYAPFAYIDGQNELSLIGRYGRWGMLLALFNLKGFKRYERLKLVGGLFNLQRAGWQAPQDQTVSAWLHAQGQTPGLIAHFWTPLALAVLNTPLGMASMARLAPVLRDTLGAGPGALEIMQPRADLTTSVVTPLVSALEAAGGQLRCSQRVAAIQAAITKRFMIVLSGNSEIAEYDHIVLTVPPWGLRDIALPFDSSILTPRFGSQPIATVYLGFAEDIRLPAPLVQLDGPQSGDARVWAIDRAHCGEPGVISVTLSADGPWLALDRQALAAHCEQQLIRATAIAAASRWQRVVTVRRATPAATSAARMLHQERSPLPGLWLAGDWTHPEYPATLEAAVQTGWHTAHKIMAGAPR